MKFSTRMVMLASLLAVDSAAHGREVLNGRFQNSDKPDWLGRGYEFGNEIGIAQNHTRVSGFVSLYPGTRQQLKTRFDNQSFVDGSQRYAMAVRYQIGVSSRNRLEILSKISSHNDSDDTLYGIAYRYQVSDRRLSSRFSAAFTSGTLYRNQYQVGYTGKITAAAFGLPLVLSSGLSWSQRYSVAEARTMESLTISSSMNLKLQRKFKIALNHKKRHENTRDQLGVSGHYRISAGKRDVTVSMSADNKKNLMLSFRVRPDSV